MRAEKKSLIAILGLSDDPERYAYLAAQKLLKHGFENLLGIHPQAAEVPGVRMLKGLDQIGESLHTLTLYVGPAKSEKMSAEILAARPQRIIFNPGAENSSLAAKAKAAGIEVVEGCTLVMLSSAQF